MKTTHGRFLGVRVFLEGIEIPVISVQAQCGIGAPATAAVTIPSADAAHDLLPRTLIHVFYQDSSYEVGSTLVSDRVGNVLNRHLTATDASNMSPSLIARQLEWNNPRAWRLLFVGEVLGYGFSKVGSERNIVLQCQDMSSYWQACQLYWGGMKTSSTSYKRSIFVGATQLQRGKSKVDSTADLLRLLNARPSSIPNLPGLLGGLVALLESATGVYTSSARKKFRGVNDFMSIAELRLKLTRMIAASPKDDSSSTFINSKHFRRYFRRISRAVKSTASFMDLTSILLGKIYHNWSSQLAPSYRTEGEIVMSKVVVPAGFKFRGDKRLKDPFTQLREADRVMDTEYGKKFKLVAKKKIPLGTDFIAKDKDGKTDKKTHDSAMTGTEGFQGLGDLDKLGKKLQDEVLADKKSSKRAKAKAAAMRRALAKAEQARKLLKQMKANPKLHTQERWTEVRNMLAAALKVLGVLGGASVKVSKHKVVMRERLHCFLFSPDIYMVPPPKCNVLFPEHIQAIGFTRNWMSEISRLWLHGRSASGRDKKNCFFSPNTSILGGPTAKDAEQACKRGISFLMPHEKYTGPIPSIEGLGDNDIFKKIHQKGLKEAKKEAKAAGTEPTNVAGQAAHSPQAHLARAANFIFFMKRYQGRTMQVTCRYSPQLICGVPALILDPGNENTARFLEAVPEGSGLLGSGTRAKGSAGRVSRLNVFTKAATPVQGTHYIGKIAQIQHVLDSSGGAQTVIQLVNCRAHTEGAVLFKGEKGDERDGDVTIQKTKRIRRYVRQKAPEGGFKSDFKASFSGVKTKQGKPAGDVTTDVKAVTGFKAKKGKKYLVKPILVDGTINPVPTENDAYSEFATHKHAVDVFEVKSSVKKYTLTFSFEGTTTPPWFSNIYQPAKIGPDFYSPLFGCASVIDDPPMHLTPDAQKKFDESEARAGKRLDGTPKMGTAYVEFPSVGGDGTQEIEIPSSLIKASSNTQIAADKLSEVYTGLRTMDINMDLFIDTYTGRNYATMLDILGNTNPYIMLYHKADDLFSQEKAGFTEEDILHPFGPKNYGEGLKHPSSQTVFYDGFHGYAFGKYENLDKLDYVPLPKLTIKTMPKERNPDGSIDPRKLRYERVLLYLNGIRSLGQR
jgi:hypothetical protein